MDPVLERCKTYKKTESKTSVNQQTELQTSVTAEQTELETPVSKQTESETSVSNQTELEIPVNKQTVSETSLTADCAVRLNNLSFVSTSLEITRFLNSLGIVILIVTIIVITRSAWQSPT